MKKRMLWLLPVLMILISVAQASSVPQTVQPSITVNWNDNKDEADARPVNADPGYTVVYANGDLVTPQPPYTVAIVSFNERRIVFDPLPKYTQDVPPVEIEYVIRQTAVPGYLTEAITDVNTGKITGYRNTLKTEIEVTKQWNDASYTAQVRPLSGDWLSASMHLMRRRVTASTFIDVTALYATVSIDSPNLTDWRVVASDLPAFDVDGVRFEYMYQEALTGGVVPVKTGAEEYGVYVPSVENVGLYGGKTVVNEVYDGGTLINTLTDRTDFAFNKVWTDEHDRDTHPTRPNVRFYLYRYPENMGSVEGMSPVPGQDSRVWTQTQIDQDAWSPYEYTQGEALPRYDELGNEYVYYAMEVMDNPGDYKVEISPSEGGFILNDSSVVNILKADVSVPFTKEWKAKALQGMRGAIRMELQRRLIHDPTPGNPDDNQWTPVTTTELAGFRGEAMTQSGSFSGQPKYDELGREYEYRSVEIAATLNYPDNWVSVAPGTDFGSGTLTGLAFNGELYDFDTSVVGGKTINKLKGETSLKVRKVWSPALDVGESNEIEVQIYRDGLPLLDVTGIEFPASVASLSGGIFTITNPGTVGEIFSKLPKYDDEGKEYVYTADEEQVISPTRYAHSLTTHTVESGIKTSVILNTDDDGDGGMRFDVDKVWIDDNDSSRRPKKVVFGLFYIGSTEAPVQVATIDLTVDSAWENTLFYVGYIPEGASGPDLNYDHYVIREISETNPAAGSNFLTVESMDAGGTGIAISVFHRYEVWTTRNSPYDYTVTNQRIGTVEAKVTKAWNAAYLQGRGLIAVFELVRLNDNGTETTLESKELSMDAGPTEISFVTHPPKYDATGKSIRYAVREVGVKGLVDASTVTPLPFEVKDVDDNTLGWLSSGAGSAVTDYADEEEPAGTPDKLSIAFANSLGGSGDLKINKVWWDAGTADSSTKRPDLVVKLYRQSAKPGSAEQFVSSIRIWETTNPDVVNNWYWQLALGNHPRFDAEGYLYNYTAKETIVQTGSKYSTSYYAQGAQPNAAGTSSETTFAELDSSLNQSGANVTFNQSQRGTIINRLQDTQRVTGRKTWLNIPGWFAFADLPPVTMTLYRSTQPIA